MKMDRKPVIIFLLTALERAEAVCRQADIIAGLTLDVLKGSTRAFDDGKLVLSYL